MIRFTITAVFIASIFTVSSGSHRIGFDKYHNYEEMTDYLKKITKEFSNASKLYSIGTSVLGRELWVVKLTTASELLSVPNIKIVGNIHGNEPVGREVTLHMIQYLLDNSKDNVINKLLRTTVIHLLPSINPDGFELSGPQPCPSHGSVVNSNFVRSRCNHNDFDLNRNFPCVFTPSTIPLQPETKAIIKWLESIPFVLSLGLHGGALVANYPYDDSVDSIQNKLLKFNETSLRTINIMDLYKAFINASNKDSLISPSLTQDDDVFRFLSKQYAKLHPTMHLGQGCEGNNKFKDGITNGAVWYQVQGSMQDYNYFKHGCMEITLEMSCCKYPPASFLESHWNENLKPLLTWMQQSHRGIKGIVTSQLTGEPISNAAISILGRQNIINTTINGEYWKILLPGVYKLRVSATGYNEKTVRVEVPKTDDSSAEGPRSVLTNVVMEPIAAASTMTTMVAAQSSGAANDGGGKHYTNYWTLNGDRKRGSETTNRAATMAEVQKPYGRAEDDELAADEDLNDDNVNFNPQPVSVYSAGNHFPSTTGNLIIENLIAFMILRFVAT